MSTPTDPYNSTTGKPADAPFLEPLEEETPAGDLRFSDDPASDLAPQAPADAPEPAAPARSHFERHAWDNAASDEPARPATPPTDVALGAPAEPAELEPQAAPADADAAAHVAPAGNFDDRAVTRTSVIDATNVEFAPVSEFDGRDDSPTSASEFEKSGLAATASENRAAWAGAPEELPATPASAPLPQPEPEKSRAWAHVGSFFVALLLLPVAWYLTEDSSARLAASALTDQHTINILGASELVGAFVTAALIWFNARRSALGAILWGAIVWIAGLVGVFMPGLMANLSASMAEPFGTYNAFTGNVVYHFSNTSVNGHIALLGFAVLATGLVVHRTRARAAAPTNLDFAGE
ncbi:hypothetical protein J2S49_001161 [Arcanobacterium wilhelmae]|uniref:Uncharacterized protein n=1 Tax=Arcanobacterium wilhelmae TaxID=1803177 RepID=A0ABT9NBK4_9ACTO|nr:hypothetical protein [Arcanobacterium wilhelmae]MDP9801085.1 hypothetical protein [Arcanobacterium wilhelmae]WFN90441.1 hypothetical protein P8A24_00840 [Arcanobacterium wilhelmae]